MNEHRYDQAWSQLLAQSAPTFAADSEPPFGFTTAALAAWRLQAQAERIGLRAVLAALAALVMVALITVGVGRSSDPDLEPGVRSLVQVGNLPYS